MVASNKRGLAYISFRKNLEWCILIFSSILLGIWAAKDTIGFRNILLITGTPISAYYIVQEWLHGELRKQYSFLRLFPIILLSLTFFWIIIHYLFFSVDSIQQFQELKSTWLRAFMASIIGFAAGLAMRDRPHRLNLLWLGLFVAFLILLYQYIPLAIEQNKLLVPDYDKYLFHLKINTVLSGMLLIVGVNCAILDLFYYTNSRGNNFNSWYLIYWGLVTITVLWSFVYIIDSRNGIALSLVMHGFWFFCALIYLIRDQKKPLMKSNILPTILISGVGLIIVFYFAFLQTNINNRWNSFFEDAKIAVQIDRYPHWQNISQMGYPEKSGGQFVEPNNYARIAWATAGLKAIISYPLGVGVLSYPFSKHPNLPEKVVIDSDNPGIATHSAWIEFGLAFGIIFLILIISILLLVFTQAINYKYPARVTIMSFVILIISLYTVGEVSTKHAVEILFYILALIIALLQTNPK